MAILDKFEEPLNESNVSIMDNVKKWALISALVGIVFQLLQQVTGVMTKGFGVIALYSIVSIGVSVAIYVFALKEHRDQELGGFMSFKRAFLLAFTIGIVSSVIALVFNYVYMNFINHGALEAQLEMTRGMMEKMGLPEDKLDEAIEKQRQAMSSPMSMLTGLLGAGFIVAILSLIIAAIMKKDRPVF